MSNALGCLLKLAGQVVPEVEFEYRILEGKMTNEIGNQVATYGAWTKARGNIQPGLVQSFNARGVADTGAIMKALGLDQSKRVMSVFAYGLKLRNVHDQDMPDQIRYHGLIYNIWSVSDWFDYDGWKALVCIEDTREREPVVYKTLVNEGMFIRNPMPYAVEITNGARNAQIQVRIPGAWRTYYWASKKAHWNWQDFETGVQIVHLENPVLQPGECAYAYVESGKEFEIIWGTDQ